MHIDEAFALLRELQDRGSITEIEAYNAGVILKQTTHSMIGWSYLRNGLVFSVNTGPGPYRPIRELDLSRGTTEVVAFCRKRAVMKEMTLAELVTQYR